MNTRWLSGLLITMLALAGLSCGKAKEKEKETAKMPPGHEKMIDERRKGIEESKGVVVAKVNGVNISMHDLIAQMNRLAPKYIKPQERSPQLDEKVKKEALDALIFMELAVQEAARQGLKVPAGVVDSEIKDAKMKLGTEEAFKKYLETSGHTETSFRQAIEKDKLLEMIVQKEIVEKVKVDEKAVKAVYDKEKKKYTLPHRITVEDIYFISGKDDEAARDKAGKVLSLIKKSNNGFSGLAPDGTFVVRNGIVDFDDYPNIGRAAAALKVGEVSGVIEDSDGLHIVKVTQKDPARVMTFEEAKDVIKNELAAPIAEKRKEAWGAQLKKGAKIEIILGVAIKD